MRQKLRLAPVLAVAALAAAGCGGSSESGTAKFVAEADPICKQVANKRTAANNTLRTSGTKSSSGVLPALARLAPGIAADEHEAVAQLRKLKAPSSLATEWRELLSGIEQLADDTTRTAVEAKAKNLKSVESITTSGRALRKQLAPIAQRNGFKYCGTTS